MTARCRYRLSLALMPLLLLIALLPTTFASSSMSADESDDSEQKQIRSCLSGLFDCFPSDSEDPSTASCSEAFNSSCNAVCPTNGLAFYQTLWSSKREQISEECDSKFCYGALDGCLGTVLNAAYSDGDWNAACNAWDQQSSCISNVNYSCTDEAAFDKYYDLFNYGCASSSSKTYLSSFVPCFPYSFFDLTSVPEKTDLCRNSSTVASCANSVAIPTDMSASAAAFFTGLAQNYVNGCTTDEVCKSVLSGCFGDYISESLPPTLLQKFICSNVQDLDTCVENVEYGCTYPDDIGTYLTDSCSGLVCEAGLESCYSQFETPIDYSSDSTTVINNFCSVSANMSSCLDSYQTACSASQNPDASFRASLSDLCQGNAVAPGDCYMSALKCFYQNFPTLTKPSSLWTTNSDTNFCDNVDLAASCLDDALGTCASQTDKYAAAIENLVDTIQLQCQSVCSAEKVSICQDSMTYYLTQVLTNATSNSSICGILSQQQSCYSTLTKRCSGSSNPSVNVAVLNSIQAAIESGTCNFTTVPTVPSGCDVTSVVSDITSYLNEIYTVSDLSADNYSVVCQKWETTRTSLAAEVASCSGGVDVRINSLTASVDSVITSLCSGQCHVAEATPYISQLNDQVQAALHFVKPTDYKGRDKDLFCKANKGQGHAYGAKDKDCYNYNFYWGSICRQINTTNKEVEENTQDCSALVKKTQKDSVKTTADIYAEQCQTEAYTCNVEQGGECLTAFTKLSVYYPLCSKSEKQLACSLASNYTACTWNSLVQCSPYFYLDVWSLQSALFEDLQCTPPSSFDVPPNPPLNTTDREKECGADMVDIYIKKFVKSLVKHSQDCTGDSDDLDKNWKETDDSITSVLKSFSSQGQCSVFIVEITKILKTIEDQVTKIKGRNKTDCDLESAQNCVADVEKYVDQQSLKIPPCGCPVESTDETKSEFCSRAKAALDCIQESTDGCDDDAVAAAYKSLYDLQNSTGIGCLKPCDSNPCQHDAICSDGADFKSYQCKCPIGFSGPNCEKYDCDEKQVFDCFKGPLKNLFAGNYSNYCQQVEEAKECISQTTLKCAKPWFDIASDTFQQLVTSLQSNCDSLTPPPTPDCGPPTVTCLSTKFADKSVWDLDYGGFTDLVCNGWSTVKACVASANGQCPSGTTLSFEAVFSFLCVSVDVPCERQDLVKDADDVGYGHWLANAKKPRKVKQCESPNKGIGHLCPKRKNKDKKDKKDKKNKKDKKDKKDKKPKRHDRKEKTKKPKPQVGENDETYDVDDYSYDACWYLGEKMNQTNDASSSCQPSIQDSIQAYFKELKTRYLSDGQCDNPCEDNDCDNLASCVPDNYGYKCKCLYGYTGPFCDDTNPNVTVACNQSVSLECLLTIKATMSSVVSGQYTQQDCDTLDLKLSCLATSYLSCNNGANTAVFQLIQFVYELVSKNCRTNTVVKTCELEAASSCVATLIDGIVSESDTYCGLLEAAYTCAGEIEITCSDSDEQFVSQAYSSYSLVCSTDQCSVERARDCLDILYNKVSRNIGDGSVCDIAAYVSECLGGALMECDSFIRGKVYSVYDSYMVDVSLQCTDACATNPCAGGGSCTRTNKDDGFKCDCPKGVGGKRCDTTSTCDSFSIEVCIEAASSAFLALLDPCKKLECSLVSDLTACLSAHSSGCAATKKSLIAATVSASSKLSTICTSTSLTCNEPASCQVSNISQIGYEYIFEAFVNITGDIGPSYEELCGNFNSTSTLLASLTASGSGCSSAYTASVNALVTWMKNVSGKDCSTPTTCQVPQAQSCIDSYNSKVAEMKKRVFCPVAQRKELAKLDKEKEKCVDDNTKKCTDTEKQPIKDAEKNSTDNDDKFIPKPCKNKESVCKDNSSTCESFELGKFKCKCPPGKKCDTEPVCGLNVAIDCVNSFEHHCGLKGLFGKKFEKNDVDDFCKRAKVALDCAVEATVDCPSDLSESVFTSLYGIQASVGWSCFGYCKSKPCKSNGACKEKKTPASFPCHQVLPQDGFECDCAPGFSGPKCDSGNFSVPTINKCFVDVLDAVIHGDSNELCSGSLVAEMAACISEAVTTCPVARREITLKISSILQTVFQETICPGGSGTCDMPTLTSSCFSELSHQSVPLWNSGKKCADDNYCRKLSLVQSCTVTGCDKVVTVVLELFGLLCSNSSVPLKDITDVIDIIEQILHKKNNTDTTPPPDDTTPPDQTENPRVLYVTTIETSTVYCDGEEQTGGSDESSTTDVYIIGRDDVRVCIEAHTDKGNVGFILASTSDDFLVTDVTWKCTNVKSDGWTDVDYEDRGWPYAVEVPDDDCKMYDRDKRQKKRAKPIWTAKQSGGYDETVYCCAYFGKRDVRIASSCTFELFIDGNLQDATNNNVTSETGTCDIDSGTHAIGVHASCAKDSSINVFILEISSGILFTDRTWKCSSSASSGWYEASFDFSSWMSAVIVAPNDGKKVTLVAGFSVSASWIWAADTSASEVYCRAPPTTVPPTTNVTTNPQPPPPDLDQVDDKDLCWYLQKGLDKLNAMLPKVSSDLQDTIRKAVQELTTNYSADSNCGKPCDENKCKHSSKCSPDGYGYDCKCLPGFNGPHCESGANCDIPNGQDCVKQLDKFAGKVCKAGDWRPDICSKFQAVYQCIAVKFVSCSDSSEFSFELLNVFLSYVDSNCNNDNATTANPPPVSCETTAILKCGLQLVNNLYAVSSVDTCGTLTAVYQCLAAIESSCGAPSSTCQDLQWKAWLNLEKQCAPPTCSVSNGKQCVYDLINSYNSTDNSTCSNVADTQKCVDSDTSGCDKFVKDHVKQKMSSALETKDVTKQCVSPCGNNHCENSGVCEDESDGSYTCECSTPYKGDFCDETDTCYLSFMKVALEYSKDEVLDSLMDSCDSALSCSLKSSVSANLTSSSSNCGSTEKSSVNAIITAINSLTCSSTASSSCSTPEVSCQYQDVRSSASSCFDTIVTQYSNEGGPDYQAVCRQWNITKSKFASVTCTQEPFHTDYTRTVSFFESIVGTQCSSPICQPTVAQSCLDALNETVTSLADLQTKKICPVMAKEQRDKLCGKVQSSADCIKGNLAECSDGSQSDTIRSKTKDLLSQVSTLCPVPCQANPCVDSGKCVQTDASHYSCDCEDGGKSGPECEKAPSCNTNKAYTCVDSLLQFLFWHNIFTPTEESLASLPQSFKGEYCSLVVQAQSCIASSVESCESGTKKKVYSALYELQVYVNATCISVCQSSPCQNDGVCSESSSEPYNCKCPPGFNGTECEEELCSATEISFVFWHSLKLLITSFGQLCSSLSVSTASTMNATADCVQGIKNISVTVQNDFTSAMNPLCSVSPPGVTPDCNITSLNVQCMSSFLSVIAYFDNPTDQQATILCNMWYEASACVATFEGTNKCSAQISALKETFGYLCVNPPPPSDVNTTCDLHESVTGIDELKTKVFKANNERKPTNVPPPPPSVGKCKAKEMERPNRSPPPESEDVCREVEEIVTKVKSSVTSCSDAIQTSVENTLTNLTKEYLNEGQCAKACEPNPCANLGSCSEDGEYGYVCDCMPGYTGVNCETGGACDESSGYTECFSPCDLFHAGSTSYSDYCRSISGVAACLSQKLLGCTSRYDEVVFQLVYEYVEAVSSACENENVTAETCEYQSVYNASRYLLNEVYPALSLANPKDEVCSVLVEYQVMVKNITITCNGATTSLTETLISKSYGAQDVVCQNPNCSISTANKCLQKIYDLTTFTSDNDTCTLVWEQRAGVEYSTSDCDQELKQLTQKAVTDLLANSNVSCASPCDTLPCRNNGTCQQTGVDGYECECTANYTGKYCEIETACNLVEVRSCFDNATEVITELLLDPCHNVPVTCSDLKSFSGCVTNNSEECPESTSNRLDTVDTAVTNITQLCDTIRPAPPNCDVQPPDCSVENIQTCAEEFLEVYFKEYSAFGGPDYGLICSTLNDTKSCFKQYGEACTDDYRSTIENATIWLSNLTGTVCQEKVCQPASASDLLTYIESEIKIYNARPGPIPDDDHTDFCFKMKDAVSGVQGNTDQCKNGSQTEIEDRLAAAQENISRICPYPCNSNPCMNNANCTETSWEDYTCECEEGFSGKTCNKVSLHPYKNHSKLNCANQDRSVITQQIRLNVPLQIFCQKYSSLFVTENGYVGLSDGNLIINFAKFCQNKHTLLAPLFAAQDCSCADSAVYYKEYFVSGTDPDQNDQLNVASKAVRRCASAKSPDFSATSVFVVTWENMKPYPCKIFESVYGVTQGSTYQLVIASNLQESFGQFIYDQVTVRYQAPFVYSGYTDLNGRCFNSVQSGTKAMDHFETVPSSSSGDNSWIYPLFDSCVTSEPKPEDKCLSWVTSAVDLSDQKLDPCPCSGRIAAADPRYHFQYIDWFRYCYATNRVQLVKTPSGTRTSQVMQTCCYDPFNNGTLLTSPPFAGFPVVLDADPTTGNDSSAHLSCCVQSNKYCGLFLSLRPIGFCNSYTAPTEALLWGDPHFVSADAFNYTFNAIGEFVLLQTQDNSFRFQTRTSVYTDSTGKSYPAAVFSSLAAQEAGEVKVEVGLNAARDGLLLYVNGTSILQNSVQNHYGNVYVAWSNNGINVTFPSGWTMTTMLAYRSLGFIHTLPNQYRNKTMGLLGNFNGNPSDDLTPRNGPVLPATATIREIHYQFGLSWQISPSESLFTYPPNKTAADFVNSSFVPAFDPPCNTTAEIQNGINLCGANSFCYYDYCVTKDSALALNTKKMIVDYSNNLQILNSLAPILTIVGYTPNPAGQYVVNASVSKLLTFSLKATSSQKLGISYYMVGNISRDSSASLNVSSGVFKWTPSSLNVVDVSFIAVDSNGGVSPKLQVVVSMCDGCSGHGTCDYGSYDLLGNGTNYRFADCNCIVGWTGARCSQDFDGCASQPCGPNNAAACTDMTPQQQQQTHLSYMCSSCAPGYYTNQCVDFDECQQGTAKCKQNCINTVGSYTCGCNKGYRLQDNFTCVDIDECAERTSSCPQVCTNSPGSYACSCYTGYQGPNCDPVVPCGANSCAYKCSLVNNQPTCVCSAGYTLAADGHSCSDVNECSSSSTTNYCGYKDLCSNTNGNYVCGCPVGLQISADQRTCQDCPVGYWGLNCSNQCDCNMHVKQCNKTNGCTICQSGWTGPLCETDVDECALHTYTCPDDSNCVNIPGTYNCVCRDPSQTNPDNTCGNNKIIFKLKLNMLWKNEYSDLSNSETSILKELLEIQLKKIFATTPHFIGLSIDQFFQSNGVGTEFETSFDTALTPAQKAAVGQTLINYLVNSSWTIPVFSTPYDVTELPTADNGNSVEVPAGNPCLDNTQCKNGGTCVAQGLALPVCVCASQYTGRWCETKTTSGTSPPGGSSSLTIGLAVGLSVGLLFVALAAVAIVYIMKRYRNQKPAYESSMMFGMDEAPLHKYEQQPVRYHPKWPFSSGTGFDHSDS